MNQNSNPDYSDPKTWEDMGVQPIVIDSSTPEAHEKTMEQLFQAIADKVDEIVAWNQKNPPA